MIRSIARRLLTRRPPPVPTYASYTAGLTECGPGYDDTALAELVADKTRRALERGTLATLMAERTLTMTLLAASGKARVLDFGGACGTAYHIAKPFLATDTRWAVVETEAMAQTARSFETQQLRFFTSVAAATDWLGDMDLVYSSGAVQYTSDPVATMGQLGALNAPTLALLRCATTDAPTPIVTIQRSRLSENGPGPMPNGHTDRVIAYPCTFLPGSLFPNAPTVTLAPDHTEMTTDGWRLESGGAFLLTSPRAS